MPFLILSTQGREFITDGVPIFNYNGYWVILREGSACRIEDSEDAIELPKGTIKKITGVDPVFEMKISLSV